MKTKHCSYAKSDMTPCVLRDGAVCFAMNAVDEPICVGCERAPEVIGVDKPPDWDKTVKEYRNRERNRFVQIHPFRRSRTQNERPHSR